MRTKKHIDRHTAFALNMKYSAVKKITDMFIMALGHSLRETGEVHIMRLGTFRVNRTREAVPYTTTKDKKKIRVEKVWVGFSKSQSLKAVLESGHGEVRS